MRKCSKCFLNLFFTTVVAHMPFYAVSHMTVSHAAEPPQAGSSKESAYQEIERGGRLYVFASSERKAEFEKSGDIGKGIIKIGYGPDGKTVVFDSEDVIIEYESRQIRELLKKVNIAGYKELKKDGRLYVFTSPARLTDFEKSGELGKAVIKIGYGPHGETVVFDSDEAVKEYNNRHSKPIVTHLGSQDKAEK